METRVLHVSQADAELDLAAILQHVQAGAEVVIERAAQPVAVIRPAGSPHREKLAGAKRRHFTAIGKQERIAKSLAALSESPYIRLTPKEWREIVEDPDLEDQFS